MIFKTPFRYGKSKIMALMITIPLGSFLLWASMYGRMLQLEPGQLIHRILPIFGGLFMFWLSGFHIYNIVMDYFTIELYEDKLIGYNFFGNRKTELKFDSIKKIGKDSIFIFSGGLAVVFWDRDGKKHELSGGMDYRGFITDYVLERVKITAEIDDKLIKHCRKNYKEWAYTRRFNFTTKYEDGYLEWIEVVVNAQKERLITSGDLIPDVVYGDDIRQLNKMGSKKKIVR